MGASGWDNVGDDAICQGIVGLLVNTDPRLRIEVLGGPGGPSCGIQATGKFGRLGSRPLPALVDTLRAVAGTNLVVIGGGGLLQDLLPNFYRPYIRVAALAKAMHKRVVWFGVGAYPQKTKAFRRSLARLGDLSDLVSVRDELSAEDIRSAGFRGDIHVIPDPAFALLRDRSRAATVSSRLCVSLRPWWNIPGLFEDSCRGLLEDLVRNIAMSLDRFVAETGSEVLMLPMQKRDPEDDAALHRWIAAKMVRTTNVRLLRHQGVREVLEFLPTCSLTFGMRLHSLILSAAAGVPTAGISYDRKVMAMMRSLGRDGYVVHIDEVDPDTLTDMLLRAWRQRADDAWRSRVWDMRLRLEQFARRALLLETDSGIEMAANQPS